MLSSSISQSLPLPLAVTFSQYVELWKRLAKHYHPFRLVWYVMTGRVLDTIPRTYILNTT
jgi:phosphatidylinositol glycan class Q protein